jgi:asparagine synthase (glutamine-hydrolysing)
MCGLAGWQGEFPADCAQRMVDAIAHRGPDDQGLLVHGDTTLGHRRLSILDLSPAGHQPMVDPHGLMAIAYNGELYNFTELRRELANLGHSFGSTSDTEVLLHAWLTWGEACLSRLNGIFAFALHDRRSGEVVLVRDPCGVKPLYYATTSQGVAFASELKALLCLPGINRDIDPAAACRTLGLLWSPAPGTMLAGVRKLMPGTLLVLKDGRIVRDTVYSKLPFGPTLPVDPATAVRQVAEAVHTAVRRQLVSDVPVGAFLSGGLDSSAVVACARKELGRSLDCFTIDTHTACEGLPDDLPYARQVARHLDVPLHEVSGSPDAIAELETMLYHLDEPHADPAPLHVLSICRIAREKGIKVLLSGNGGDDIFTGYRRHRALMAERWWAWLPARVRAGLRRVTATLPSGSTIGRRLAKAFQCADLDPAGRLAGAFLWLPPQEVPPLLGEKLRGHGSFAQIVQPLMQTLDVLPRGTHDLERMLALECRHFLADHNLPYTDKLSMAVGVEVRVPLLDPDLIALAASLPAHLKQRGAEGKWIFKKAMEPLLPREIIWRPKSGFGSPLRHWLHHELADVVNDTLSQRSLSARGLFDATGVSRLMERNRRGSIDATYPIFSMVCMELWCRMFIDGKAPERLNIRKRA